MKKSSKVFNRIFIKVINPAFPPLISDRLWKNYRLLACFLDFHTGALAVVKLKKSTGLLLEVNFDD